MIGEDPKDGLVFNVFPRITGTANGRYDSLDVFGTDYDTRDGTCVRDYIHVMDIAHAHTLSLQFMDKSQDMQGFELFNLGTGNGITVLELISAFQQASGVKLHYDLKPRREGDVEAIYANNEKAQSKLGWTAARSLDTMMRTAWQWELACHKK